jgi:DNA-binding NtrC family response regulator
VTVRSLNLPGMIGRHPSMVEVYELVRLAATTSMPVLVEGETGTGKELVARALHKLGPNPDGPFVDVNCAAIPEGLAEAELFGWERGAFTGAHQSTKGVLELSDGGTLLLDEACSLSVGVQAKLLRAIELRDFRRVGGRCRCSADFRIVATISEPLAALVEAGRLRADFAFRIAGLRVRLPKLSARGADVKLLAEHFLDRSNTNGHRSKSLDESAVALIARYHWPGNVRELKTMMERLDLLCADDVVTPAFLRRHLELSTTALTKEDVVLALEDSRWNAGKAAQLLRIGRTKLYALMKSFSIQRPDTITPPCSSEQLACSHEHLDQNAISSNLS